MRRNILSPDEKKSFFRQRRTSSKRQSHNTDQNFRQKSSINQKRQIENSSIKTKSIIEIKNENHFNENKSYSKTAYQIDAMAVLILAKRSRHSFINWSVDNEFFTPKNMKIPSKEFHRQGVISQVNEIFDKLARGLPSATAVEEWNAVISRHNKYLQNNS